MNKKQIEEQVTKMGEEIGKIGINCDEFCGYLHVGAAGWEAPNGTDALTRKEQVEKIAKERNEIKDIMKVLDKCPSLNPAYKAEVATVIYGNNYRKLPEDSIVLSREEYEKLQETISDLKYDKFDLKNEISEKDNKIALLEETIDCIKFNVGFARKETAEKIFDILYQWLDLENIEKYGFVTIQKFDFLRKFREIYKQFGLEIKEKVYGK